MEYLSGVGRERNKFGGISLEVQGVTEVEGRTLQDSLYTRGETVLNALENRQVSSFSLSQPYTCE